MFTINHLSKNFGKLRALDGISANFQNGQSVALIGPNGSGKTTLIKALLGMVVPDSGEVIFNGKNIGGSHDYRSQIGYMPQIGRYPDNMKIGQLFEMMTDLRSYELGEMSDEFRHPTHHSSLLTHNSKTVDEELIEAFDLRGMFQKTMRTLSGGTRQKVSAALAFLFKPPVLILDEPTAGLDPLAAEILKKKILRERDNNRLFLVTSHILSDLDEISTHILYLMDGKLQFFKDLETLKTETGEEKLGRAIAKVMLGNGGGLTVDGRRLMVADAIPLNGFLHNANLPPSTTHRQPL